MSSQVVHGMGESRQKTWKGEVAGEKAGRNSPALLQKGLGGPWNELPQVSDCACPHGTKCSRGVARRDKVKVSLACKWWKETTCWEEDMNPNPLFMGKSGAGQGCALRFSLTEQTVCVTVS